MAQQAIVTLTAITPEIVPGKRVLKLNPDRLAVPIGRASKSVSKGLLGAEDNAWFDNPVMSRDHAELSFDQENMSIMIKDVRSMHGTQLNDVKLSLNTPQPVKPGDTVAFGAEVRRGPETFPPCCFYINYEFVPWSRGFQFPDSSDVEDELDHSEEEAQIRENPHEDDVTPVESPLPKQSFSMNTIDLTRDEPELAEKTASTREHSAKQPAADTQAETRLAVEENGTPLPGRLENPILLEDIDSDESEEYDFEEENEELDYEESEERSNEGSDEENDEENDEILDEVDEESVSDWESSEIMAAESCPHIDNSGASQSYDEAVSMPTHMFYDNKDIPMSSMRTTVGKSFEAARNVEVETHNCQPIHDVAWDAVLSDGIDGEISERGHVVQSFDIVSKAAEATAKDVEMRRETHEDYHVGNVKDFAHSNSEPAPMLGSTIHPSGRAPFTPTSLSQRSSTDRQPSPSDAAMVKSVGKDLTSPPTSSVSVLSITKTINPDQIHHLPKDQWNQFTAQTLGDKTGKHDFFRAREVNRARVHDEESHHTEYNSIGDGVIRSNFNHLGQPSNPCAAPSSSHVGSSQWPHAILAQQHQQMRQMAHQQIAHQKIIQQKAVQQQLPQHQMAAQQMAAQQMAAQQMAAQQIAQQMIGKQMPFNAGSPLWSPPQPAMFTRPDLQPRADLNDPKSKMARAGSPEFDMTSAVKFNQSKESTAVLSPSTQPGRSAVHFNDILEPPVVEPSVKSSKRKAPEISDVLEEEVRVWASKDALVTPSQASASSDAGSAPALQITKQVSQSPEVVEAAISADAAAQERASKKLKKLAEVVGYAALTGVAVGAGLFSIFAATAPEFP